MKKLYLKLKSKKGFTLVESVVAITILAIASMMFATFLATSNRMTMLTLKNEEDYKVLQEALATGNSTGSITVQQDKDKSFIIDLEGSIISVNGKYVTVTNPESEQSIKIFVGDNVQNITKSDKGPFTVDEETWTKIKDAYTNGVTTSTEVSIIGKESITIDLNGTKIYKSGDSYVVVVSEKKDANDKTIPAVSYSINYANGPYIADDANWTIIENAWTNVVTEDTIINISDKDGAIININLNGAEIYKSSNSYLVKVLANDTKSYVSYRIYKQI